VRENGSVDHLPTPGNDYLNFRAVLQARLAAQQHNLQPASARHVLEVVAGFTNGTPARPSYDTLASITGLGTYQVRRLIDALVEAGYLTETREPRKGGGWATLASGARATHVPGASVAYATLECGDSHTCKCGDSHT
jgi:hypothetical protein